MLDSWALLLLSSQLRQEVIIINANKVTVGTDKWLICWVWMNGKVPYGSEANLCLLQLLHNLTPIPLISLWGYCYLFIFNSICRVGRRFCRWQLGQDSNRLAEFAENFSEMSVILFCVISGTHSCRASPTAEGLISALYVSCSICVWRVLPAQSLMWLYPSVWPLQSENKSSDAVILHFLKRCLQEHLIPHILVLPMPDTVIIPLLCDCFTTWLS